MSTITQSPLLGTALVFVGLYLLLPAASAAQISGAVGAGATEALQQLQMQRMLQQLTDAQTALLRAQIENVRLQTELARTQARAEQSNALWSSPQSPVADDWTTCRAGLSSGGRQWNAWIAGYLSGLETGADLPEGTVATAEKLNAVVDAISQYCPAHLDQPIKQAVPLAIEAAGAKKPPR